MSSELVGHERKIIIQKVSYVWATVFLACIYFYKSCSKWSKRIIFTVYIVQEIFGEFLGWNIRYQLYKMY